jgi:uncharacterized membrane protein
MVQLYGFTTVIRYCDWGILAVILVLALAVRLLGINRGLPYVYYIERHLIRFKGIVFYGIEPRPTRFPDAGFRGH